MTPTFSERRKRGPKLTICNTAIGNIKLIILAYVLQDSLLIKIVEF